MALSQRDRNAKKPVRMPLDLRWLIGLLVAVNILAMLTGPSLVMRIANGVMVLVLVAIVPYYTRTRREYREAAEKLAATMERLHGR